jgi:hypothetical protein
MPDAQSYLASQAAAPVSGRPNWLAPANHGPAVSTSSVMSLTAND